MVAYYGVIDAARVAVAAGSDATDARWFPTKALPLLAFDLAKLLPDAIKQLDTLP